MLAQRIKISMLLHNGFSMQQKCLKIRESLKKSVKRDTFSFEKCVSHRTTKSALHENHLIRNFERNGIKAHTFMD